VTQKKLKKMKKKSNNDDDSDDDDNDDDVEMSNQKVLDWPVGNTNHSDTKIAPVKKHRKGFQKKTKRPIVNNISA
jgi:hypothetical protein